MQRNLLNALLAALATTALIGALVPVIALGHDGGPGSTCPEGGEWSSHFNDDTHTESSDFGSIAMTGSGSDELLTADINDNYTVEICVKQASDHTHFTVTSENDGTIWDGDLSHWSYRIIGTPPSTTPTTRPTTTTTEGSTTSTSPTTTTTIDTTTTVPSTTSTSSPATTTSTTDPSTTSTIQSSSSTTSSDESQGSTLPFTGGPSDALPILALSLLATGTLIVAATRRADAD